MVQTRIKAGPTMPKRQPQKVCPVCGKAYDFDVLRSRPDPRVWLCPDCMEHIQNGETAFVCVDKRFAWATPAIGTKDLENHVIQDIEVSDFEALLATGNANGNAPANS